jgi:hypothetical protein
LEEVESPKQWPIHSTTALTSSRQRSLFVLAAGIVFLLAQIMPSLTDLTMPPPLSGATIAQ